jgi:hypothetical protein
MFVSDVSIDPKQTTGSSRNKDIGKEGTVVKYKKIADQPLKREKECFFSIEKLFSLSYRFQNTYSSNETHHLERCQVKD